MKNMVVVRMDIDDEFTYEINIQTQKMPLTLL